MFALRNILAKEILMITDDKYFETGICKIIDRYDNYSTRQCHNVIPIFSVFDHIPSLIGGIIKGKSGFLGVVHN